MFFSITLACSLFAAGFGACTLPTTTGVLSRLFSDFQTSVYLPNDTVDLAVATRDYTVDTRPDGDKAAAAQLASKVFNAARNAAQSSSPKASAWKGISLPAEGGSVSDMYQLAAVGAPYALGENEMSHLDDCNALIGFAVPMLIIIAVIAAVLGIILGTTSGMRAVGWALIAGPLVLLAAMIIFGIWAIIDFYGFFAAFHGLFFPQGNWTFPANSLLICMLPTAFWIGMLVVWITVTVGLSLVSVFTGRYLLSR